MKKFSIYIFWIFLIIASFGCSENTDKNNSENPIRQNEILSDSSQNISKIKYAQNFDIQSFGNYKILTIRNTSKESKDSLQYILLNENTPKPANFKDYQIITIPIKRVVCLSGTQLGMIDEIGKIETVLGVSNKDYIASSKIHQQIIEGKTHEVGEANTLNEEAVLALNPDVILVSSGIGNSMPILEKMQKMGMKILINADWLETTPLGRAEWLKLIGILYNSENETNQKFDKIETNYKSLTQKIQDLSKPKVITDVPYKGTWYLPSGESYMAHFLADAGADYYKKNTTGTGSIPIDFEEIYSANLKADFWVNMGSVHSKEALLNLDKRFGDFEAFQKDNIYSYNRRKNEQGTIEYFETSIIHPDLVLADLIKIFHPEVLPNHEFYYYNKLK